MNTRKNWLTTGLLLFILLLALGLRLYGLDAHSLWNDEGISVALAQRDPVTIARDAARDIHPPLYYWLLGAWLRLSGPSEVGVRSLSALLGVCLVLLTYSLGSHLLGRWAGLVASFLAAINPFQIYYSQEARMYVLLAVIAAGSALALIRLVKRESLPVYVVLLLLEAAGLYTHYSFAFVVLVLNLAYFLCLVLTWRSALAASRALGWALSQVGVLLLYLPWLPTAIQQVRGWPNPAQGTALRPSLSFMLVDAWRWQVFGPTIETSQVAVLLLVAGLLAIGGILFLLFGWTGKPAPYNRWSAGLLVLWIGLPLFLMAVLGLYREAYLKFLLVSAPALSLLLASGLTGSPPSVPTRYLQTSPASHNEARTAPHGPHSAYPGSRRLVPGARLSIIALRSAQLLAAGGILAGTVLALHNYYADPAYARDDYRGMAAYIEAVGRSGDAILLNAPGQQEVFRYYYDGDLPIYPLPEDRPLDPGATASSLVALVQPGGRVFALFWATEESDPERFVEGWLDERAYKALDSWYGNVRLVLYAVPYEAPAGFDQAVNIPLMNPDTGDEIVLLGYGLQSRELAAGDIAQFSLFWQADETPAGRYKVFLHALDGENHIVGQRDAEPAGGARLTTLWAAGEIVADNHGLPIHPATPPGDYRVEVGMYDPHTGQRLVTPEGTTQIWLEPLTIERPLAPAPLATLEMLHVAGASLDGLTLLGYDAHKLGYAHQPEAPLRPGDLLQVSLYWQAEAELRGDWRVAIALVDRRGQKLAEIVGTPVWGYPISQWQEGDIWRGQFTLALPRDIPPGSYRLQVQPLPADGTILQPYLSEPMTVGP